MTDLNPDSEEMDLVDDAAKYIAMCGYRMAVARGVAALKRVHSAASKPPDSKRQ